MRGSGGKYGDGWDNSNILMISQCMALAFAVGRGREGECGAYCVPHISFIAAASWRSAAHCRRRVLTWRLAMLGQAVGGRASGRQCGASTCLFLLSVLGCLGDGLRVM